MEPRTSRAQEQHWHHLSSRKTGLKFKLVDGDFLVRPPNYPFAPIRPMSALTLSAKQRRQFEAIKRTIERRLAE
jgi:hypothetical protein